MGADHDHHLAVAEVDDSLLGRRLRIAGIAVLALAAVGLVALWPRGDAPDLGVQPFDFVDATVVGLIEETCPGVEVAGDVGCRVVDVRLTSGPDSGGVGTFTALDTNPEVPDLAEGDDIVLRDVASAPPEFRYSYSDFQRQTPLLLLLVLFTVVVVAFGRWQGLRALLGLGVGVVLLVVFLVPALLRDEPVVLVALTAGVAIAGLALYLAHGFNAATTVALFGTIASLLLVTLLALLAVALAQLSGLAQTEAQVLSVTAGALDLRGLLVAGIVIGALGSLDDVTVSQVSTVAALRRVDPTLGSVALYREAIRVGRDHVASSVNTLVLAYAGASLPLLLFFAQSTQSTGRILTREIVAAEIVRMLVGSIGLIAAVPLTTGLAAWVLSGRGGPDPAPDDHDAAGPRSTDSGPRWDDFGPADDLA